MLGSDPDAVKGTKGARPGSSGVALRPPLPGMLIGFLVTIVLEAFVGIGPTLLIKRIVDELIGGKDESLVTTLGLLMIAFAFADALLSLAERWWSGAHR